MMLRAAFSLSLVLSAHDAWAQHFLFRSVPQDIPGFSELPTRYLRSVKEPLGEGGGVFAVTASGLGISYDGGKTYSMRTMQSGLPSNRLGFLEVTDDGVIYATTHGERRQLSISLDGGNTFKDITKSLPVSDFSDPYVSSMFTFGKRVMILTSNLQAFYNTDSEGGSFVGIDLAKEFGASPDSLSWSSACAMDNGDVIVATESATAQLKLGRIKLSGNGYTFTKISASDQRTAEYMKISQNGAACFTRNGSQELALTRLNDRLAFLVLNNNATATYSHSLQIPTDSNWGDSLIYPQPLVRRDGDADRLFILKYPTFMQMMTSSNGTDTGFYEHQLNSGDPRSDQNQITNINRAVNGDWLVATAWGWFRCDNTGRKCNEVVPTFHRFYDSGVLDQGDQGFTFPGDFFATNATNSSATHPLFYTSNEKAWNLDMNFQNPIAFEYPDMEHYDIEDLRGAASKNDRLALLTTNDTQSGIGARVYYVEKGDITFKDLPVLAHNVYPQISGIDVNGERVFVEVESDIYVSEFGGDFKVLDTGDFGSFGSFYSNGDLLVLSASGSSKRRRVINGSRKREYHAARAVDGTPKLAISFNRGANYTIVTPDKLGLPADKPVTLGSYQANAIAAVGNALYTLAFSPLASKLIFVDNSTDTIHLRGTSDSGIWYDAKNPGSIHSDPRIITASGACYKVNSANGFSGEDDYFGSGVAGVVAGAVYFASMTGVVQQQPGFTKKPDCGVAQGWRRL